MENPYESPQCRVEPAEGDRGAIGAKQIGTGVLGFLAACLITGLVSVVLGVVISAVVGGQYRAVPGLIATCVSPGIAGPLVGIALWAATRKRARPFGRGALVLGVACFLVVGGCLLTMLGLG
jgi:hypothetical protein